MTPRPRLLADLAFDLATRHLARWCGIRSYFDSATHGIIALGAIGSIPRKKPWLLALPAAA